MSLKKFSGGTRSLPPPARFINMINGVVPLNLKARGCTTVFRHSALFPHTNVDGNVDTGSRCGHAGRRTPNARGVRGRLFSWSASLTDTSARYTSSAAASAGAWRSRALVPRPNFPAARRAGREAPYRHADRADGDTQIGSA